MKEMGLVLDENHSKLRNFASNIQPADEEISKYEAERWQNRGFS